MFSGFRKACHLFYKFDSKTEKDFAIILDSDDAVIKWMRPARNQFNIYYDRNSRRYVPDFVVETVDAIHLVETKKAGDVESDEVRQKADAARQYCHAASEYTAALEGKPWSYILIPHDAVKRSESFRSIVTRNLFPD